METPGRCISLKKMTSPGWLDFRVGKEHLSLHSIQKRMITESIYVPDSTNPSYKPYLRPALDWLQQNMPTQLDEVYQDNKLVQTEESAKKWVMLLTTWREKTRELTPPSPKGGLPNTPWLVKFHSARKGFRTLKFRLKDKFKIRDILFNEVQKECCTSIGKLKKKDMIRYSEFLLTVLF